MFCKLTNKIVKRGFYFFKQRLWFLLNKPFFKYLGEGTFIDSPLKITKKYIECGEKVYIWKFCRIEGVSQYNKQTYTPKIIFEDGVTIQQFLHLTCANQVKIGKNTAVAASVTITDIHHPYKDTTIPIEQQDIDEILEREIGKLVTNVESKQGEASIILATIK